MITSIRTILEFGSTTKSQNTVAGELGRFAGRRFPVQILFRLDRLQGVVGRYSVREGTSVAFPAMHRGQDDARLDSAPQWISLINLPSVRLVLVAFGGTRHKQQLRSAINPRIVKTVVEAAGTARPCCCVCLPPSHSNTFVLVAACEYQVRRCDPRLFPRTRPPSPPLRRRDGDRQQRRQPVGGAESQGWPCSLGVWAREWGDFLVEGEKSLRGGCVRLSCRVELDSVRTPCMSEVKIRRNAAGSLTTNWFPSSRLRSFHATSANTSPSRLVSPPLVRVIIALGRLF